MQQDLYNTWIVMLLIDMKTHIINKILHDSITATKSQST